MNLHNLKPANGSTHRERRIGRGQGSGKGGTSTRGHKGAQSRSGYSRKIGFEGGQMPIYRILPKRGFKNINRVEYSPVNLSALQQLAEKKGLARIDREALVSNGLVGKRDLIAVLAKGELTATVHVVADKFSAKAKEAIERCGGTAELANAPAAE